MTSRRDEPINWDEHRRKIFLEHLSPRTTRDSLREYLADYQMDACVVPHKDGKNQGFAFVIFHEEQSVDTIMTKRPHTIDGQTVEFYRSVPDQGSLKDKKAVTELVISDLKRGTISKADLERRFGGYGGIVWTKMDSDNDSCVMEFKDYDSVDQILLDRPHNIKGIEIQMRKGNRKNRLENSFAQKTSSTASNDYKNNVSPKKSCLKVQIDPQASSLSLPTKIYCVHITNLSPHVSGDYLAQKFGWPLGDILIAPSTNDQSSTIECWIKRMDDKRMAEDFVKKWNGQKLLHSRIECAVDEDKPEFCNKFRMGQCLKRDDECDWDHVVCTAEGSCSNDCRHGHGKGVKTGFRDLGSNDTYRIKITGFEQKLTIDYLERTLREKKCFILRSDDTVGYVGPLLTMKYARRLINKWHNKDIDGQRLQCQIECNIRSIASTRSSRAGSRSSLASKDNDDRDFERSRPSANSSANNSRESSLSRNDSDTGIRVLNDVDINYEPRLYQRSVDEVVRQRNSDIKKQAKSADHLSSYTERKSLSGSVNDLTQDSPIVIPVRHRNDHDSTGSLIKHPDTNDESFRTHLNALNLLEGVKGVVQLIKTKEVVGNNGQRSSEKNKNALITTTPPGLSLTKFVQQESRGGFGVLEAIQLVQKLTTIVQEIHSRNVFHQNLGPETIMIDWDRKSSPANEAQLTIQDFSQAYIKSDKKHPFNPSTVQSWYKPPQADAEPLKYIATNDPSSICALLFWLLTNTDPKHTKDTLPHQQDNVTNKLDNKIAQAVRNTKTTLKQPLEELQLKNYLFDTFSIAFGYPQYSPWSINDLQCRLESIHELLSPRKSQLDTIDAAFGELISISHSARDTPASTTNTPQDAFQRAAMAFQLAKKNFLSLYNHQFFWFDGGCKWVEGIDMGESERRHDDVLTYEYQDKARRLSGNFSIIITCIATLADEGNLITLSLGSSVDGKTCRIPIGRYSKNQNIAADVQKNFAMELGNLIKSIAKERRLTTSE